MKTIIFSILDLILLPTGIFVLLNLDVLAEKFKEKSESHKYMGVTPTSVERNKLVFMLMSITAILIGGLGISHNFIRLLHWLV